jgi:hypothetical protein
VQLSRVLHLPSRGSGPKDCRCGHSQGAHEHYRRGTDCALCQCPKFKAGSTSSKSGSRGTRGEQAHAA